MDSESESGPLPSIAVPEFNSALNLAKRLRDLELEEADASLLAEQRLAECPETARRIADKIAGCVNYDLHENQYCSLVSLDINESLLIEQIKARRPRVRRVCAPDLGAPQPQLSDLQLLTTHYEFPAPAEPAATTATRTVLPPGGVVDSVLLAELRQHADKSHRRRMWRSDRHL